MLLEAASVSVAGTLAANGGGGGGGPGSGESAIAQPGEDAIAGADFAQGGAGADDDGDGGRGGAIGADPGPGESRAGGASGAGGGAVGRIRINTPDDEADLSNAIISPEPTTGSASTR